MTSLTINLKDFILIFTFFATAIGLWLKIRKLRLNDLDDIRKDFANYKKERGREDIKIGERLSALEACVKALKGDIKRLNQK